MNTDRNNSAGETHRPDGQATRRHCRLVFPGRDNLHPYVRLAFAALANIFLAVWVLPKAGHATDPEYAISNWIWPALMVVAPCAALLSTVPVLLFGRDVPRLISIGLSFLPCYVAIAGFCDVFSLWLSGK
jgi:hypothetical protein